MLCGRPLAWHLVRLYAFFRRLRLAIKGEGGGIHRPNLMLWSRRWGSMRSSMDVNCEKTIVFTGVLSTSVLRISSIRRILEDGRPWMRWPSYTSKFVSQSLHFSLFDGMLSLTPSVKSGTS